MSIRSPPPKINVEVVSTGDIASKLFSNLEFDIEARRPGDDALAKQEDYEAKWFEERLARYDAKQKKKRDEEEELYRLRRLNEAMEDAGITLEMLFGSD